MEELTGYRESVCVLLSCMYQDHGIIERTNIQTDVVVINQADEDRIESFVFTDSNKVVHNALFVTTTERGLSRSRNMAIRFATADICLICDDDEYLHDGYEQLILQGYRELSNASLIAFSLDRKDVNKNYPQKSCPLGFRQIIKTSSLQLTFRKKDVEKYKICFDVNLGSGTGNGGGEENKFQLDFKRHKLKMYYHPNCIATVNPGESQWFYGYTKDYFTTWGWSSRRIFGNKSLFFIPYFVFSHRRMFKDGMGIFEVTRSILHGWCEKREIKEQ